MLIVNKGICKTFKYRWSSFIASATGWIKEPLGDNRNRILILEWFAFKLKSVWKGSIFCRSRRLSEKNRNRICRKKLLLLLSLFNYFKSFSPHGTQILVLKRLLLHQWQFFQRATLLLRNLTFRGIFPKVNWRRLGPQEKVNKQRLHWRYLDDIRTWPQFSG